MQYHSHLCMWAIQKSSNAILETNTPVDVSLWSIFSAFKYFLEGDSLLEWSIKYIIWQYTNEVGTKGSRMKSQLYR